MNYLKTLIDLYRLKRQAKLLQSRCAPCRRKKLRKMMHHAWEHSAYYRRTFEAAGITEGQLDELPLSCFPTLNKKELLGHFDELVVPKDLRQRELSEFDAQKSPDRKPIKGNTMWYIHQEAQESRGTLSMMKPHGLPCSSVC